jgi:hypothetical protein
MGLNPIYTYRLSGRRVMMVVALGVCAVMLAFAAYEGAPWYFYAPVGLAGAMALWAIIANPQSGSELNAQSLSFFYQGKTQTIPIADITAMKVTRWSDGPDTVALHLRSGETIHVPSLCADSKLAIALRDLGVDEVG